MPTRLPTWLAALCLLSACGGGGGSSQSRDFEVAIQAGPTPHAVMATLAPTTREPLTYAAFRIRTKPGGAAADVDVVYEASFLAANGHIDPSTGEIQVAIFGLYLDHENEVTIEFAYPDGGVVARDLIVSTLGASPPVAPADVVVEGLDPRLELSYLLVQSYDGPRIVDIDGETRWMAPATGERFLAAAPQPDGIVVGSLDSSTIAKVDWLGRIEAHTMSDPRCVTSHHNIEPAKHGLFNTVAFVEVAAGTHRPESVLAEMSQSGVVSRLWDFDTIFSSTIEAAGEDPAALVQNGEDWFHMNSAVYDATDDGVLVSSRENFVVKVDYETGAIRWILGNPDKLWFTGYPLSLQPLALDVIGDAPIGQHSLTISSDGSLLTVFNNGLGNRVLPDVGDSRSRSTISVYSIDEAARVAEEVLSLDCGASIYSPICSSAYWTEAGNIVATFSSPSDESPPRLFVVNDANEVLFEATVFGDGCPDAYAARELDLSAFVVRVP